MQKLPAVSLERMLIEKVEKGKVYDIEWRDGFVQSKCCFVQKHRNFFIFLDENNMKVICRPESIKKVTEIEKS